jgi:hypothetical protein
METIHAVLFAGCETSSISLQGGQRPAGRGKPELELGDSAELLHVFMLFGIFWSFLTNELNE